MVVDPNEERTSVPITEPSVGRRAGVSAPARARELRRVRPVASRLERLLDRYTEGLGRGTGALGGRVAGLWLGRLPEGWFAFHDVPVGERDANIDHLVVGPGGVFTITTRSLRGAVRVSRRTITHQGHRTALLPKAVAGSERASRLLSLAIGREVSVRPVLAILADEWTVIADPVDVIVRGPRAAKNLMLAQPVVLRPSDVIVVAAAAAKPGTWTRTA